MPACFGQTSDLSASGRTGRSFNRFELRQSLLHGRIEQPCLQLYLEGLSARLILTLQTRQAQIPQASLSDS